MTRLGPENIMGKAEKLSLEAAAAETEEELWSLFFTPEVPVVP
jgi:hypothetical protein